MTVVDAAAAAVMCVFFGFSCVRCSLREIRSFQLFSRRREERRRLCHSRVSLYRSVFYAPVMADSKPFWFFSWTLCLLIMVHVPLYLCSHVITSQDNTNFTTISVTADQHVHHHHISARTGVRRISRRDGKRTFQCQLSCCFGSSLALLHFLLLLSISSISSKLQVSRSLFLLSRRLFAKSTVVRILVFQFSLRFSFLSSSSLSGSSLFRRCCVTLSFLLVFSILSCSLRGLFSLFVACLSFCPE